MSSARYVEQTDWARPDRKAWVGRVLEAISGAIRPVVLVGHGIGAITVVHAAARLEPLKAVRGAMLVAPPSEASVRAMAERQGLGADFAPYPRAPLPFPSLVVGSRNDPLAAMAETEDWSFAWGGRLLDAGEAGHIDVASGHGPWPEGLMSFAGFLKLL